MGFAIPISQDQPRYVCLLFVVQSPSSNLETTGLQYPDTNGRKVVCLQEIPSRLQSPSRRYPNLRVTRHPTVRRYSPSMTWLRPLTKLPNHMVVHESQMVVAVGKFPSQPPKASEPPTLGSAPPATVGSKSRSDGRVRGFHKPTRSLLHGMWEENTEAPAQRAGHRPTPLHV